MKVLVFVKATPNSEQGLVHDEKLARVCWKSGRRTGRRSSKR
jgi:hypothetical protein